MLSSPAPEPPSSRWLLRRADQAAIAALVLFSLGAMACYWIVQGGLHGRMIHIDRVDPLTVHYQVDLNTAEKPELVTLPEIGDTLGQHISITASNTAALIRSTTCGGWRLRPENDEALAAISARSAASRYRGDSEVVTQRMKISSFSRRACPAAAGSLDVHPSIHGFVSSVASTTRYSCDFASPSAVAPGCSDNPPTSTGCAPAISKWLPIAATRYWCDPV